MPFKWEEKQARYRDTSTGKFVKAETVTKLSTASIQATGDVAGGLAEKYTNKELRGREFKTIMRDEIKREVIRQYVLGRGGLERMDAKGWGQTGATIADQYKYLDGFVDELKNLSQEQIAARAKMYINSAREGYEKGRAAAVKASGAFTEEHWVVDASKENCSGCLELQAKGWVKIGELGTFPGAGSTPCLTKCGCGIIYR